MEWANNLWTKFGVIAAAVALLAGFIGNVDKITDWAKVRLRKRKQRREAPVKALEAIDRMDKSMTLMSERVHALEGKVTDLGDQFNEIDQRVQSLQAENTNQSEMLTNLDKDMADVLCSQLTREHDYFVHLGYCPTADKNRINLIYTRYKERRRNHLADRFIDDVLDLPDERPE